MRRAEAAYLAGFFDGEGSISLQLQQGKHLRVEVSCSQNTIDVLWMYVRFFRGNVYEGQRCYQWKAYGMQAIMFLRTVRPYLIVKRLDAEDAIRAWENRNNLPFVADIISRKKERREQIISFHDERTAQRNAR